MSKLDIIHNTVTITDLLSHYSLHPDRNFIKCPFHQDKTASLKIYPKTNTFHCFGFGCRESGDVVDFVAKMEHCDIKQAISILNELYHLNLNSDFTPEEKRRYAAEQELRRRQRIKSERLERYTVLVLIKLSNKIRFYEKMLFLSRPTDDDLITYADKYSEANWDLQQSLNRAEWLYNFIGGINLNRDSQYYYEYGDNKTKLLRNIWRKNVRF